MLWNYFDPEDPYDDYEPPMDDYYDDYNYIGDSDDFYPDEDDFYPDEDDYNHTDYSGISIHEDSGYSLKMKKLEIRNVETKHILEKNGAKIPALCAISSDEIYNNFRYKRRLRSSKIKTNTFKLLFPKKVFERKKKSDLIRFKMSRPRDNELINFTRNYFINHEIISSHLLKDLIDDRLNSSILGRQRKTLAEIDDSKTVKTVKIEESFCEAQTDPGTSVSYILSYLGEDELSRKNLKNYLKVKNSIKLDSNLEENLQINFRIEMPYQASYTEFFKSCYKEASKISSEKFSSIQNFAEKFKKFFTKRNKSDIETIKLIAFTLAFIESGHFWSTMRTFIFSAKTTGLEQIVFSVEKFKKDQIIIEAVINILHELLFSLQLKHFQYKNFLYDFSNSLVFILNRKNWISVESFVNLLEIFEKLILMLAFKEFDIPHNFVKEIASKGKKGKESKLKILAEFSSDDCYLKFLADLCFVFLSEKTPEFDEWSTKSFRDLILEEDEEALECDEKGENDNEILVEEGFYCEEIAERNPKIGENEGEMFDRFVEGVSQIRNQFDIKETGENEDEESDMEESVEEEDLEVDLENLDKDFSDYSDDNCDEEWDQDMDILETFYRCPIHVANKRRNEIFDLIFKIVECGFYLEPKIFVNNHKIVIEQKQNKNIRMKKFLSHFGQITNFDQILKIKNLLLKEGKHLQLVFLYRVLYGKKYIVKFLEQNELDVIKISKICKEIDIDFIFRNIDSLTILNPTKISLLRTNDKFEDILKFSKIQNLEEISFYIEIILEGKENSFMGKTTKKKFKNKQPMIELEKMKLKYENFISNLIRILKSKKVLQNLEKIFPTFKIFLKKILKEEFKFSLNCRKTPVNLSNLKLKNFKSISELLKLKVCHVIKSENLPWKTYSLKNTEFDNLFKSDGKSLRNRFNFNYSSRLKERRINELKLKIGKILRTREIMTEKEKKEFQKEFDDALKLNPKGYDLEFQTLMLIADNTFYWRNNSRNMESPKKVVYFDEKKLIFKERKISNFINCYVENFYLLSDYLRSGENLILSENDPIFDDFGEIDGEIPILKKHAEMNKISSEKKISYFQNKGKRCLYYKRNKKVILRLSEKKMEEEAQLFDDISRMLDYENTVACKKFKKIENFYKSNIAYNLEKDFGYLRHHIIQPTMVYNKNMGKINIDSFGNLNGLKETRKRVGVVNFTLRKKIQLNLGFLIFENFNIRQSKSGHFELVAEKKGVKKIYQSWFDFKENKFYRKIFYQLIKPETSFCPLKPSSMSNNEIYTSKNTKALYIEDGNLYKRKKKIFDENHKINFSFDYDHANNYGENRYEEKWETFRCIRSDTLVNFEIEGINSIFELRVHPDKKKDKDVSVLLCVSGKFKKLYVVENWKSKQFYLKILNFSDLSKIAKIQAGKKKKSGSKVGSYEFVNIHLKEKAVKKFDMERFIREERQRIIEEMRLIAEENDRRVQMLARRPQMVQLRFVNRDNIDYSGSDYSNDY